ncbi:hypothetical protein ABVL58_01865 [Streptococcus infantarius]|uniref:hypothetical protein n=1 Tax=Streptococcus infantarius TaxID=102684 RepID=UPI00336A793B
MNNEERGAHKPDKEMSFDEYLAYYDPEHSVTLGINQVSDKKIKLEWTGTDTILARLFSIANSFDAELEFVTELNDDYSLKRHVLNVYKKGNLGSNKTSSPVCVGKELKVINYSDSIEDLRTAVRATGKDGLTIDGLNKKIYDDNKELLYYSSGNTVYAPQSRDRFPSVGQTSNDNWLVKDLGETEYETKEALWGYMYGEIQKICLPKIEYKVTGAIDSDVGDTQTLIDDVHYEPPLYLKARVSELTDDILQGKVIDSTFINFERQYSQIADSLLKQVEALANDAAPYIVRLSTDNGYNFKNGQGTSTITAKLEKYSKIVNANWKWLINNSIVSKTSSVTINASQVTGTLNVVAVASVDGNEVAREYITFTNSDDGVGIKSIKRYYTTNDQAEGVTAGGQNWSTKPTTVTADNNYMWSYDVITYTNDTSLVTEPAVIGARGDDGLDADTTGITEALDKAKQELTALSANIEKVRNDSLAAVEEAKQQLTTVANDLNAAKQDLQNAVSEVDTKATNLQSEVSNLNTSLSNTAKEVQTQGTTLVNQAKELQTQASQLTEQAKAQETLTTRVENVEATADGTKTTVSELSKTVSQNGKDITSVSNRTKTVETGLTNAKTSISELQTSVSTAQTDLTNLTRRTKTVEDDLSGTKTNLSELTQTVSSDGRTIASLTSRTKTVEDSVSGLKTTMSSVQKDLTAVTTRTKTVEDDLAGTKTTLSQVQTTANSTSQKTATLETGLNGLNAKFDSLSIGAVNLFKGSRDFSTSNWINNHNGIYAEDYQGVKIFKTQSAWSGRSQYFEVKAGEEYVFSAYVKSSAETDRVTFYLTHSSKEPQAQGWVGLESADTWGAVSLDLTDEYQRIVVKIRITKSGWIMPRIERFNNDAYLFFGGYKLERGNIATDYSPNEADLEQKVAEYRQNADQNYASLQSTVQNLDGTVTANKATAEQTAAGFKTRIESLETYKDGETTRANQYFESAKTETARQLTAERTAIANNYVAKSTYTSDVTGIRNDLTATTTTANTTKTNLANYQASNDRAVANLQSNLQTANGNISSLKTKVEAVPGQITSAVSAVEGKIPKSLGGRNLIIRSQIQNGYVDDAGNLVKTNDQFTIGFIDGTDNKQFTVTAPKLGDGLLTWFRLIKYDASKNFLGRELFMYTRDAKTVKNIDLADNVAYFKVSFDGAYGEPFKIERGSLATDWSPAPEDAIEEISSLSSQIQQTADGMTLLATKTELNTAKSDLQSGITTATNKANTAQSTANNNAQTINTHTTQISALNTGLQAKVSQTEFNTLSGRVTTAENNITAKANELSSKITSVEGKIPTSSGGRNLAQGTSKDWSNPFTGFSGIQNTCPNLYKVITDGLVVGDTFKTRIVLKYTDIKPASGKTAEIWIQGAGNVTAWNSGTYPSGGGGRRSLSGSGEIVFELTDKINADHLKNDYWSLAFRTDWIASGSLQWKLAKVERGMFFTDWSPAPEDYDSKLASAQSEIKQTTDAITASVSSVQTAASNAQSTANTAVSKADAAQAGVNTLDSTTVKTATLNLDNNGFVTKVGKTVNGNTFATMIAQNESDVQIIAKKMKVSGDMIVDGAITAEKIKAGAITADKIAANSISSSKIVSSGITANVIKGGVLQSLSGATNFELDTGKLFYNNNNTGVFRVQDGASTMGLKFSNTPVTVNGTSRILSRAILGGDRRETTLDDGKWDKGGFSGIIIETIKGVEPAANERADALRAIGDNIYFTHTYSADSPTGISAHGWKMETYAPDSSYSGNIVLKPYGINYRQSDIIVGDIRLDNGDGSGYWMRATINVLKACFGHILNGGLSSGALNAIRSELDKISGT